MEKIRPGIYQFALPYLPSSNHHNNVGLSSPQTIAVEIHVGRKEDLEEGKWITVIAYSSFNFSDYVETVFSNIRFLFLREIFHPYPITDRFYEEKVRLVEVHTKSLNIHDWHELDMKWDHRHQMYSHPVWKAISSEAWFFQAYQKKIQYYARSGLDALSTMQKENMILFEIPLWLIRVLQETETFIQTEKLKIDSIQLVIYSLKRLAGMTIHSSDYASEITALIIEEMNYMRSPDFASHYTEIVEENQQVLTQ